ncbi:hypothetical protein GQR58_007586 [Nymphon striatum]|nr:hypothetical protein GQR58_007586 [Nymphon striatum]
MIDETKNEKAKFRQQFELLVSLKWLGLHHHELQTTEGKRQMTSPLPHLMTCSGTYKSFILLKILSLNMNSSVNSIRIVKSIRMTEPDDWWNAVKSGFIICAYIMKNKKVLEEEVKRPTRDDEAITLLKAWPGTTLPLSSQQVDECHCQTLQSITPQNDTEIMKGLKVTQCWGIMYPLDTGLILSNSNDSRSANDTFG